MLLCRVVARFTPRIIRQLRKERADNGSKPAMSNSEIHRKYWFHLSSSRRQIHNHHKVSTFQRMQLWMTILFVISLRWLDILQRGARIPTIQHLMSINREISLSYWHCCCQRTGRLGNSPVYRDEENKFYQLYLIFIVGTTLIEIFYISPEFRPNGITSVLHW